MPGEPRMITRRKLCTLALAGLAGSCQPVWAEEKSAPAVVASTDDGPAFDIQSNLEDQIRQYIDEKGLAARETKGEIAVMTGISPVAVPASDPNWVKYRMLAYETALQTAKAEWISRQSKSITVDFVTRAFKAANQDPPAFKTDDVILPDRLAEIIAKIEALGVGHLDDALREHGIDPAKFEKLPPAQRHVQLASELLKTVTTTSIGDLVGLTTVQTFEGHDEHGHHQIAVIAVISPKLKSFAQSVLKLRGNFPADPAKAQDLSALSRNKDALLQDFGVRWVYDQAGMPLIASFYQWGLDNSANDPILAAKIRDVAVKQATELADAQIAQFLAGSAVLTKNTSVGERYEKAVERAVDGYIAQKAPLNTLLDGLNEVFNERAHVDGLTGLRTLATWGRKHPMGDQMVVGVIRIWSASGEMATRAVKDARPLAAPPVVSPPQSMTPGLTKGRDLNSADDF
ncbi:hypothetical protein M2322_004555 [Rhodoblastus acidophilus]|uniref:DUF6844 domain-containing protein n=1 Tax=Rhodoblastus acidophilus TaxID=1074 RepID=UPI002224A44F|nr:hypothetical protein [Rhodoblastus acidophilus]MCW2318986.1 hypothetical protein [Rhodoblastus acidophilus]